MMSYSILNLSYDFTIEQLFAKNKQETEQYFEFQKEFAREDNVFLLVHKNASDFNPQFLDSLENLVIQIKDSPYFLDAISLIDIKSNFLHYHNHFYDELFYSQPIIRFYH